MKVSILIPARMAATRFPGKPLTKIMGKPMIQWVYERASLAGADEVIVATDSDDIFAAVEGFGGLVRMTRDDHENGTQRIAEVAEELDSDLLVNVQGDEPCIHPKAIESVIQLMVHNPELEMGTLARFVSSQDELFNPNVVKLVRDQRDRALYFSRSPIPFRKHPGMDRIWWEESDQFHLAHIGIYAYRGDFLPRYVAAPPCALERIEGLEQLRALYMGASIGVALSSHPSIGVDTPQDVARAEAYLQNEENRS